MISKKIKRLDIFARDVKFFHKGQEYYSTRCGCVVTSLVALVYLIMVVLRWTEFFGETDPVAYFSETR